MPALQNDTLIRALLRQPTAYTPVWLMRQAGRYLPEYNETRRRAGSFLALCKSPSLAAEVTLQPIERFPLDAAILFSDILTIPDAMGLGLYFTEGEGPRFERPLAQREAHAAPAPRPSSSPSRDQYPGRRGPVERADRSGSERGDDLRHMGREPFSGVVQRVLPRIHPEGVVTAQAQLGRGASPGHRVHQGRGALA